MSEAGDYTPAPYWSGHDFKAARSHFDHHAGRSYDDAVASKKAVRDLIEKALKTNSEAPLVVVTDQTGSMGRWPGVIFSKLPYLDHEAREYLGETMETCFAAIGDASNGEDYPLQVRPFAKGADMKKRLEELVIEGQGGGSMHESYELAALYFARKVTMPNAVHPILIFIGDEMPYERIAANQAEEYVGVKLRHSLTTAEVFEELKRKFRVYIVLKPYGDESADKSNAMGASTRKVYNAWAALVGEDHIAMLPEAQRVVDVIFGILAQETGRVPYFKEEIEDRQKPEQVEAVYESLKSIHAIPAGVPKSGAHSGRSIMRRPKDGPKSKSLI